VFDVIVLKILIHCFVSIKIDTFLDGFQNYANIIHKKSYFMRK